MQVARVRVVTHICGVVAFALVAVTLAAMGAPAAAAADGHGCTKTAAAGEVLIESVGFVDGDRAAIRRNGKWVATEGAADLSFSSAGAVDDDWVLRVRGDALPDPYLEVPCETEDIGEGEPATCTAVDQDGVLRLDFDDFDAGDRLSVRRNDEWLVSITGDVDHLDDVAGSLADEWLVRVRGAEFATPYSSIECAKEVVDPPPPPANPGSCTVTPAGLTWDDVEADVYQVRRDGQWVASTAVRLFATTDTQADWSVRFRLLDERIELACEVEISADPADAVGICVATLNADRDEVTLHWTEVDGLAELPFGGVYEVLGGDSFGDLRSGPRFGVDDPRTLALQHRAGRRYGVRVAPDARYVMPCRGLDDTSDFAPTVPGFIDLGVGDFGDMAVLPADRGIVFRGDGTSGDEPWISDGTVEGTRLLRDITRGELDSSPSGFAAFGDHVYFIVYTGQEHQLWRTDGTTAGTERFWTAGRGGWSNRQMEALGGRLYFQAPGDNGNRMWSSDGTLAGTVDLGRAFGGFVQSGDAMFFVGAGAQGTALWVTDGTVAGSAMVVDLHPEDDRVANLSRVDGGVVFSAQQFSDDVELFVSDGTAAGTSMLRDINVGKDASFPGEFRQGEGVVWFKASSPQEGRELWVTDGTPAGTRMIELADGAASPLVNQFQATGEVLIASFELQLIALDAFGNQTVLPQPDVQFVRELSAFDGEVFAVYENANLVVLSRTDGTPAGTSEVFLKPIGFSNAHRVIGTFDGDPVLSVRMADMTTNVFVSE